MLNCKICTYIPFVNMFRYKLTTICLFCNLYILHMSYSYNIMYTSSVCKGGLIKYIFWGKCGHFLSHYTESAKYKRCITDTFVMRGVYRDVGCGILGPKNCGMRDFWAKKMWDVGFLGPKYVGCGILKTMWDVGFLLLTTNNFSNILYKSSPIWSVFH